MAAGFRVATVVQVGEIINGGGRTSPNPAFFGMVAEGLDNIHCVLKIEPKHRLAKELMAAHLASHVGIAHAPGGIGVLEEAQLSLLGGAIPTKIAERHLCYFSDKLDASPILGNDQIFNKSRFALELLVFDQFIANFDRVPENVLTSGADYWAYDHDKILFFDSPEWCELPPDGLASSTVAQNTVFWQPEARSAALKIAEHMRDKILGPIYVLDPI